ncbi:MAG: MSHA biogenesis protein MshG, partial [Enterobacterales bacterium]
MTSFVFKGRNTAGALVSGEREAGSENELAGSLIAEGIVPTSIKYAVDKSVNSIDWDKLLKGKGKVTLDELIIFSRQMYSLMKAGVPMIQALRGLATSSRNELLKETLEDVIRQLE